MIKRLALATMLAVGGWGAAQAAQAAQGPQAALLAVNRQVDLSATGNLLNYKELFVGPGDRENGWDAGLQANGSVMFNLRQVHNLYAAVQFNYADGDIGYFGNATNLETKQTVPVNSYSGLTTKTVMVELGKGFFATPRLLLTPVAQFGSRTWDRAVTPATPGGYDETYHHKYAGLALHADFAATDRLVLRGRLGWAETFNAHMDSEIGEVPFELGSRPLWQAGAGLDYRVFRRLHLSLGADYTYFSYGRSPVQIVEETYRVNEPGSWSSGLVVHGGVGVSF